MRNLDKTSFINQVDVLKQATSVQGKIYHSIKADSLTVSFTREGKSKPERIKMDELYALYQAIDYPTNKEARQFISGRVQSPAVSIINALGKSESKSATKQQHKTISVVEPIKKSVSREEKNINKDKDETRFFQSFAAVLGERHFLSKSIDKTINTNYAFLSDDFRNYSFPDGIELNFKHFLAELNSNFNFSGKSIAHNIDGLLVRHPQLGNRIVEFDEEQHFTPSLYTILNKQTQAVELAFSAYYLSLLKDMPYLNDEVLKKNRIKYSFEEYPRSHKEFLTAIQSENVSGYIKPKQNGFPYLGGRVAQRAYYDSLRNVAHLSPMNKGFKPILRFPKKYFEDKSGMDFSSISSDQIRVLIKKYLNDIYNQQV